MNNQMQYTPLTQWRHRLHVNPKFGICQHNTITSHDFFSFSQKSRIFFLLFCILQKVINSLKNAIIRLSARTHPCIFLNSEKRNKRPSVLVTATIAAKKTPTIAGGFVWAFPIFPRRPTDHPAVREVLRTITGRKKPRPFSRGFVLAFSIFLRPTYCPCVKQDACGIL